MFRLNASQVTQLARLPHLVAEPVPEGAPKAQDGVRILVEGHADVFIQAFPPGLPERHRDHLFRLEAGDVLMDLPLPVDDPHLRIVVVGSSGARTLGGRLGSFLGSAPGDLAAHLLAAFAGALLEGIAQGLGGGAAGKPILPLRPGASARLAGGTAFALAASQGWIRVASGTGYLLGDSAHPLDASLGPIPLVRGIWLEMGEADGAVEVLGLDEWPEDTRLGDVLDRMVPCLMSWKGRRYTLGERDHLGRQRRQEDAERDRLRRSLAALASLTGRVAGVEAAPASSEMLTACRLTGAHAGITFQEPPRWVLEDPSRDLLTAICRASRVRAREVVLRGTWWKRDAGAILAFLDEGRVPVALLPQRRGGGYFLAREPGSPPVPLDPDLAARLHPFGYTFYRPGPPGPMGALDLLRLAGPSVRNDLGWVLAMALFGGVAGMALPMALGQIMAQAIPQADVRTVGTLFVTLAALTISVTLLDLSRGIAMLRIEGRTAVSLQAAVVDRLLTLPAKFFRGHTVGDLVLRATAVEKAQMVLSGAAVTGLLGAAFSGTQILLLFAFDPTLAWVALGLVLAILGVFAGVVARRNRLEALRRDADRALTGLACQLLTGVVKLRVAAAEGRGFAIWCERLLNAQRVEKRDAGWHQGLTVVTGSLPFVSTLVLMAAVDLWRTGPGGGIQPAAFMAFNAAFSSAMAAAVTLGGSLSLLPQVKPIFDQARPILEAEPEVDPQKPDPGRLRGGLEISRVSFRYLPEGPPILRDISLHAHPGEFVALAGPSGSGKSTLLRLLLGFERPETGVVRYDEHDLDAVDVGSLRSQIGVVLQGSRLLGGSIWQNIVGSSLRTLDEAWAAAEAAGLADDIREMPMGMHTALADGGGTLSGGQRQKLLIARALVHKPRIILFDEATSALDNRTQATVSRSLDRLNATRLVIAHRLSTIRNADRIYVLDQGRLVQDGTFRELGERAGLFRDLALRQRVQ
ncbi:NHLP bacteriocin export ABC transporter permease/ATPase subunit [Mesoterricola silvestris]|uniref:NHLP bacteriocin export ABC transporter permease/ATPase subunit n=1 Tax=Mesoterricola silvestris TaxID=2927979 RepID=A0AA48GMY6_9BACT|nr:NHLP bacteriocin export ABC transporter permease/ATPase subunit [Mesoterricola silvestris]BDU70965.1 hypothetical protein METEAL_01390 [Mesoterricola silvestris]